MQILLALLVFLGYALVMVITASEHQSRNVSLGKQRRDRNVLLSFAYVEGRIRRNSHNKLNGYDAKLTKMLYAINENGKVRQLAGKQFLISSKIAKNAGNRKKFGPINKQYGKHRMISGSAPSSDISQKNASNIKKSGNMHKNMEQKKSLFTRFKIQSDISKEHFRRIRTNNVIVTIIIVLLVAFILYSLSYLIMHLIFSRHSEQHRPLLEQPILVNPARTTPQGLNQV